MERARTPQKRAELEAGLHGPELPELVAPLWRAFVRLSARRGSNGFGLNPISWPDLDAFVRHSGVALAPWEVEAVERLDGVFLAQQAEAARARAAKGKK